MTPQEAYVKGLDDAENRMISAMNKYMETDECDPFQNPLLEDTWQKFIKFQNSRVVRKLLRGSPPPQEEIYNGEKSIELLMEEEKAEDVAFIKRVDEVLNAEGRVNENSEKQLKKALSGNKKVTKSKAGIAKS